MALYKTIQSPRYTVGIWKIEEDLNTLLGLVNLSAKDSNTLSSFSSVKRKTEWVAVRVLLKELIQEERQIEYTLSGKPYFLDNKGYLSISHTDSFVAVIYSSTTAVSIDIERFHERVNRVAYRFINEDEEYVYVAGENETWMKLLVWSTKETIYKYIDTENVDWLEHIKTYPFMLQQEGSIVAKEYRTPSQLLFYISYFREKEFVLTWTS